MKNKLLLGFCIITAFTIASCKKNSVPKPPTDPVETKKDTDVYVCGFINDSHNKPVAVYWKNGVVTRLAEDNSNSRAEAITVVGNDIYVAGQTMLNTPSYGPQAVYWKNGVLHVLTDSLEITSTASDAVAITIKDDKVYAAGRIGRTPGLIIALSWEDGYENALFEEQEDTEGLQATGIAFKGNDLYVTGSIKDNNINLNYHGGYWKNGKLKYLPETRYTNSEANAICVKGDDIYMAGHDFDYLSYHALSLFWKNDMPTETHAEPLPAAYASHGYAISVDSNNVYVAGKSRRANRGDRAVYWKNTQQFNLPDSSFTSVALGIAASRHNIFVVGYYNIDLDKSRAVLWKNGTLIPLSESESQATGIALLVH